MVLQLSPPHNIAGASSKSQNPSMKGQQLNEEAERIRVEGSRRIRFVLLIKKVSMFQVQVSGCWVFDKNKPGYVSDTTSAA